MVATGLHEKLWRGTNSLHSSSLVFVWLHPRWCLCMGICPNKLFALRLHEGGLCGCTPGGARLVLKCSWPSWAFKRSTHWPSWAFKRSTHEVSGILAWALCQWGSACLAPVSKPGAGQLQVGSHAWGMPHVWPPTHPALLVMGLGLHRVRFWLAAANTHPTIPDLPRRRVPNALCARRRGERFVRNQ